MDSRKDFIDLYDIYEKLLTDKQREYFTSYYFLDLSTGEIASNLNISRNAVHDHIKKTCNLLMYYEENLGLKKKNDLLLNALNINEINNLKEEIKKIIKE